MFLGQDGELFRGFFPGGLPFSSDDLDCGHVNELNELVEEGVGDFLDCEFVELLDDRERKKGNGSLDPDFASLDHRGPYDLVEDLLDGGQWSEGNRSHREMSYC